MSMGWVRFENTMPENLKVAPVSDRAFRLWISATCYCSRAQTDGRVPARVLTSLSSSATKRSVVELLDAGLLDQMDERTYLVHDYLDHNPSRERITELREDARERTAKWRGHNNVRDASQNHHPRVRDRSGSSYDTEVRDLCEKLDARIRANDPRANPQPESERWQRDMRLLVKDRGWSLEAVAEIERIVDWCQSDAFWRSNILSPGKLRKQFTTLLLRADAPSSSGGSERKARGDRRLAALERLANGGEAA